MCLRVCCNRVPYTLSQMFILDAIYLSYFLAGASSHIGWAFGLGLERFAMKLFDVPDIRLFWSEDPRFLSQFQLNEDAKFKPFSKYPPSFKDISFWVNQPDFSPNDLFEVCRAVAGDWIEEVRIGLRFKILSCFAHILDPKFTPDVVLIMARSNLGQSVFDYLRNRSMFFKFFHQVKEP